LGAATREYVESELLIVGTGGAFHKRSARSVDALRVAVQVYTAAEYVGVRYAKASCVYGVGAATKVYVHGSVGLRVAGTADINAKIGVERAAGVEVDVRRLAIDFRYEP
jgi:dihydroorotate dehydrogenase